MQEILEELGEVDQQLVPSRSAPEGDGQLTGSAAAAGRGEGRRDLLGEDLLISE